MVANVYFRNLSFVDGLGWRRLEVLVEYFGDVSRVWKANSRQWQKLGVDRRIVRNFRRAKDNKQIASLIDRYEFVPWSSDDYPKRLRVIASPPIGLWYEGDLSIVSEKTVAVVGSRRMSAYGRSVTRKFVRDLVRRGCVIVSGLAQGIDGVAHTQVLDDEGKTIAVVAHGLDSMYPNMHRALRRRIIDSGGLVLSEYPPGVRAEPRRFVVRNRIVAGLSDVVLVTEAPQKSGTKITVGFAAEQGKDVYVVPGPIDLDTYHGSHEIIRDGGMPVSHPREIKIRATW